MGLDEPADELDRLAHRVIVAAIEVHRVLGPGLTEQVYENALSQELSTQQISHQRQPEIQVQYKGTNVGSGRIDLWIEKKLILELKAVETLAPVHAAQLNTYLKITNCKLGLLINFNVPFLKQGIKRIINNQP